MVRARWYVAAVAGVKAEGAAAPTVAHRAIAACEEAYGLPRVRCVRGRGVDGLSLFRRHR
jgi:hypothetical protein